MRRRLELLVLFAVGSAACVSSELPVPSSGAVEEVQAAGGILAMLPKGDPCRDVLAPLAIGLIEAADGPSKVSVLLEGENVNREYRISFGYLEYRLTLSNDSSSRCWFDSLEARWLDASRPTSGRGLSRASSAEKEVVSSVAVVPADDPCGNPVRLITQAISNGSVGKDWLVKATATLIRETDEREYDIIVDGKSFDANGQTFLNDFSYSLTMSNDSSGKCVVSSVEAYNH